MDSSYAAPFETVKDYRLTKPWTTSGAGFCRWSFAEKDGKAYFIKELLKPVWPTDDCGMSPDILTRKREICRRFYQRLKRLYQSIRSCDNGNIVIVNEFFLLGSKYYIVTNKVDSMEIDLNAAPYAKRKIVYQTLAHSLSILHDHGIVHSDLKPDNVLLSQTKTGAIVAKLIDFGSSFLLAEPPRFGELEGDQTYLAPETCLAMNGEDVVLNEKMDVFSLGLMIHRYETGSVPRFAGDFQYPHEAVLDGAALIISDRINPQLQALLRDMLQKDAAMRPSMHEVLKRIPATPTPTAPPAEPPRSTYSESPRPSAEKRDVWFSPEL